MSKKSLHFTVNFESLMKLIRDEWAGNNQEYVWELLSGMVGLTRSDKIKLIQGTKKMVNDPDDPGGGLMVDDDFEPYKHYLCYGGYAKPDTDLTLLTGWIADNGYFYHASYGQHENVAGASGLSELEAEKAGWIKLTKTTALFGIDAEPNKKQKDTLFDWCTANKLNYDEMV